MKTDRDTVTRRFALALVIVSATVLSYSTLHHRAIVIGIPEWAAWFYPVLYDAFILGASRMWQNTALSASTRRLAKYATLFTISAAIAAFIIEFAPSGLAATFGALMIPAVLAWALVLTSRAAADRKETPETPAAEPTPEPATVVPVVAPKPVAAKLEGSTVVLEGVPMAATEEPGVQINTEEIHVEVPIPTKVIDIEVTPVDAEAKRAWVHEQLDLGLTVTGATINSRFGGRNGARLLKSVQAERAARNGTKKVNTP